MSEKRALLLNCLRERKELYVCSQTFLCFRLQLHTAKNTFSAKASYNFRSVFLLASFFFCCCAQEQCNRNTLNNFLQLALQSYNN
jgi:hypothetical protein